MSSIVASRLDEIAVQLSGVKLHLEVMKEAEEYLHSSGWSPTSGAQKLESIIRTEILRPLAVMILEDKIPDDWVVKLEYNDLINKLTITPEAPPVPVPATASNAPTSNPIGPSTAGQQAGRSFTQKSNQPKYLPVWSREERDSQHYPGPSAPILQLQPQRLF